MSVATNRAGEPVDGEPDLDGTDVAVIGMAGRFPGAADVEEYWQLLRDGVSAVSFFSAQELAEEGIPAEVVGDPRYVPAKGYLPDADMFDAAFFGYSPREAAFIDPQQRLFLECARQALEHAGIDPALTRGIGVYAGSSASTYLSRPMRDLAYSPDAHEVLLGNDKDQLTTRTSYKLDLDGPSVCVQSACSTSLVAVHLAVQGLLSGDCDVALAGGVSATFPARAGYRHFDEGINSRDGRCRAFDAAASGTVHGDGVGVVVLKRLAGALRDGDRIHAVVKGSAVNNDGSAKVGYSAPSVTGQSAVIRAAHEAAGVDPATIGYVEAHGTGTALGDPAEVAALTRAFREGTDRTGYCAIGSVKSNIGHLDVAAGVAGLIKAVLAVEHGVLPPTLHVEHPNPAMNIETTPFVVNTEARAWPAGDGPRRAGVSSFGLGGTNAHVVLEEAPTAPEVSPPVAASLILLSAKTATALETLTGDLASYLERHPDIDVADVAHTTQVGRTAFEHRRFAVCRDTAAALQLLTSTDARARATRAPASAPAVAFLLPGQGSQYPGMAARLYDLEPGFRREFDRCRDILAGLGVELADAVACPAGPQAGERLRQTENAQPALFAMEYALARLWQSWGIEPQALLGHSIGEYVAACLAGVFSLTDALTLVAARGRLMQQAPRGAMLSVALGEAELGTLPAGVEVAAVNAPDLCVVAGPEPHIDELAGRLAGSGVRARRLHTSHAFHSPAMAEVAKDLRDLVESVKREPPSTPFISNVTGEWVTSDQARDPDYWATHTTAPVRFADGIATLAGSGYTTLLEAGPGQSLTTFARRCGGQSVTAVPSMPAPGSQTPDDLVLESALGELWSVGAAVDWRHRNASRRRRRVPLPTYPFERQRYRLVQHATDAGPALTVDAAPVQRTGQADHPAPEVDVPLTDVQRAITAIWVDLLGVDPVRPDDDFFALGGHSLLGTALIATLRERFGVQVRLRDLFAARTVTRLADLVESLQWSAHASCEAPDGTPAHYEEGHL